ncbi:MAG: ATP-binding protein [Candidatus Promineifilaceae bacterium]
MLRSVRWRLILNSLIISVMTIIGVGVVTLLLVDSYFERQEQAYLEQQADIVVPMLAEVARWTGDDLRQIVAVTGMMSDVRIEILDPDQLRIADSGPRTRVSLFGETGNRADEAEMVFSVDRHGSIVSVNPRRGKSAEWDYLDVEGHSLEFDPVSEFTNISETTLQLPLVNGNELLGYIQLSEGPAVGTGVIESIQTALVGGSVAALLVAIIVGSISARQVTRPLIALGTAADQMASADLTARAPQSRLKEYDKLAGQFNDMADRLAGTIEELQEEREVLRRMIGDASHELRTPLTALKTFNTLLQDEVPSASMAGTFVSESGKQIDQLDQMTTGLLDLSRLEGRLSGISFETADLRLVVDNAVRTVQALADVKQQLLINNLPDEPINLPHDATAMQQAVRNLLTNAIKYTQHDGLITITLSASRESIEILVEDNGAGISAESLPQIFNRFYRDPVHKKEGTGLGLAIAQEIVHIHNGTIRVTSKLAQGSRFIIRLPR